MVGAFVLSEGLFSSGQQVETWFRLRNLFKWQIHFCRVVLATLFKRDVEFMEVFSEDNSCIVAY